MLGKCALSAAIVLANVFCAACAPSAPHDPRAAPLVPSKDAFYAVPHDFENTKPGDILRHRAPPAKIAAFGLAPVRLQATYQLQYRTTDNVGNATATVLTVMVPHNADTSKVLSYQVAEDAASIDCAPSYGLQLESATGPLLGTILTQAEILLIEAALEQGWVVILPDYEGPQASYLAHRLAGQATLDGIRAALRSGDITGIDSDARVAMWGYSGGSTATAWAAEIQPIYAPELNIAGAAIGGTTPNITNVLTAINKSAFTGLVPAGIQGLCTQYPELKAEVDRLLKPEYREKFDKTLHQCLLADAATFLFNDVVDMFTDPQFMYANPVAVRILNEIALGQAVPQMPIYWYKSVHDEVSPIADSDAVFDMYCAGGATVEYVRDRASEHGSAAATGAPRALAWLRNVLDGERPEPGCSKQTVISSLMDKSTLEIVPKFILDALLDLIGKPVGPILFG
ncbi:hypothetical protein PWT90_02667 [Aphanocladium album]|nr:hypothetical protein PWT90_02667 [Aphanocladium album]